jgi:KaiC/GvpD/RAD55 family RecA-like ATPase
MSPLLEVQAKFISASGCPEVKRMVSSGIPALDQVLGGEGYPAKSAILIVGPAGIGKEALGYFFTQAGLEADDYCAYMTRLTMNDVVHDQRAFGVRPATRVPVWVTQSGGQAQLDVKDLGHLQATLTELMARNSGRKIRLVFDVLSSLLMLNKTDKVYEFLDGLIKEVKDHDAVLLATLEEGMHPPETRAAMQQLFDGVVELSFQRSGTQIRSLLRILKMRGTAPQHEYFSVTFTRKGMELGPAEASQIPQGVSEVSTRAELPYANQEATQAFDYLLKAFLTDYRSGRLSIEQSGWRTRSAIAEGSGVDLDSFYGREGKFGQVMKELLSSGLVESRYFSGQRGRGGEVVKFRVSYEKELVKRLAENAVRREGDRA